MNIDGTIKKINMMKNTQEKRILIKSLYEYLYFLSNSNQISKELFQNYLDQILDFNELFYKVYKEEAYNLYDYILSLNTLNNLYKGILKYANNYHKFIIEFTSCNFDKLYQGAKDFFKYLGNDVYNLFERLYNNNLIIENASLDAGTCYNFNNGTSGIIIHQNIDFISKVITLVHEMGHAYYNYLSNTKPSLNTTTIALECPSLMFEQLFLLYLNENNIIGEKTINNLERSFHYRELLHTNSSYIINKLINNNQLDFNFNMHDINKEINKEEYNKLGIFNKVVTDNNYINFYDNFYSYGYLFSNIIREKFIKNEKETLKYIKEILSLTKVLNTEEFINLFSKEEYLNQTNKNISRVFKKTK